MAPMELWFKDSPCTRWSWAACVICAFSVTLIHVTMLIHVVIGLFHLMVCVCMWLYTFFYFVAQICRAHPWSSWLWQQEQDAAPHWHERLVFPLTCRIPGKRLLAILSLFLCKHRDENSIKTVTQNRMWFCVTVFMLLGLILCAGTPMGLSNFTLILLFWY